MPGGLRGLAELSNSNRSSAEPEVLSIPENPERVVLWIATFIVLRSLVVLVGWATGADRLTSLFPDWIAMQPITAVALAVGGLGLAAAASNRRLLLYGTGGILALIGLLSLVAYGASHARPSLDLVMFRHAVLAQYPMPARAGRPGPIIAALFILLGAALPLGRLRSPAAGLAGVILASIGLAVAGLSLLASLLLWNDPAQTLSGIGSMNLPAAVTMAALSMGLLWLRRDLGWMHSLTGAGEGPRIARVLLPTALVPIGIAAVSEIGLRLGLYDAGVRLVLMTELGLLFLLLLVFWVARRVGRNWLELQSLSRTLELPPVIGLARALDLSPVIVRSPDGEIEHWPHGCEALYGWTAEEALGAVSHDLLRTQFPQPLHEIEAMLQRDGEWVGELQQVTQRGDSRWVAARWVLQDRGPNTPPRIVESLSDITDLTQAATALRDSEDRLAQAVATYELGIVDCNPQTGLTLFSPELERIAGVAPGELSGDLRIWLKQHLPEDLERIQGEMEEDLRRQRPRRNFTTRIKRGDEIRELRAVRRYVYSEGGVCGRIITIYMDVTEQVRDRAEKDARGARLMELQSDLTHVSRLSAMGEMAAALAHELNQPLTAVSNSVGAIGMVMGQEGRPMDAKVRQQVLRAAALAEDQALRAGEIVRRLREFIARGEADSRIENLADLIDDAVALVLPNPKAVQVEFHRVLSPEATFVLADRIQIQQILVNLIRNAVEAMRDQTTPRVLTLSTSAADGMAVVGVADTGPGVAPDVAERLFSPFMSTKSDGMGVGLSICRRIVEAHGGAMWLEAADGGGADFRFRLPLISPEATHGQL
jgi:two-component system sensor kinase FixL